MAPSKRTQVPLGDIQHYIASARTSPEWQALGLAGQTKILAAERLVQILAEQSPDGTVSNEDLKALGIPPEVARQLIDGADS